MGITHHYTYLPQVALSGIVVRLVLRDLLETLNVAVDISIHVVVSLLTTGSLERVAWHAAGWGGEVAVGLSRNQFSGQCEVNYR